MMLGPHICALWPDSRSIMGMIRRASSARAGGVTRARKSSTVTSVTFVLFSAISLPRF